MGDHGLVLITCGSPEEARLVARVLVEESLAAGAQIIPIDSVYRWEGDVVDEREWLLIVKTRTEQFPAIEERVGELHSYEVPPLLMLEMSGASRPYLDWIDENVAGP